MTELEKVMFWADVALARNRKRSTKMTRIFVLAKDNAEAMRCASDAADLLTSALQPQEGMKNRRIFTHRDVDKMRGLTWRNGDVIVFGPRWAESADMVGNFEMSRRLYRREAIIEIRYDT